MTTENNKLYNRSELARKTGVPIGLIKTFEQLGYIKATDDSGWEVLFDQEAYDYLEEKQPLLEYTEAEFAKEVGTSVASLTRYRERGILKPAFSYKSGSFIRRYYTQKQVDNFGDVLKANTRFLYPNTKPPTLREKNKEFRDEIAVRLKEVRLFLGFTLEEMADKIGVTKQLLSRYENGQGYLNQETIDFLERNSIRKEYVLYGELPKTIQRWY